MSLEAAAMEEAFVLDFIELLNPERPARRIKTAEVYELSLQKTLSEPELERVRESVSN